MGIPYSDGNTVTCCENSGVKDQNGNELRLCSAIDKERTEADENAVKNAPQMALYYCPYVDKKFDYQTDLTNNNQLLGQKFYFNNGSCNFIPAQNPLREQNRCECSNSAYGKLKQAPKYILITSVTENCFKDAVHGDGGTRLSVPACRRNDTSVLWQCENQKRVNIGTSNFIVEAVNQATGKSYHYKYINKPYEYVSTQVRNAIDYSTRTVCDIHKEQRTGYYILERDN